MRLDKKNRRRRWTVTGPGLLQRNGLCPRIAEQCPNETAALKAGLARGVTVPPCKLQPL